MFVWVTRLVLMVCFSR